MITVCEENKCSGCMACVNVCGKKAITILDSKDAYNAKIDTKLCVNCDICKKVCHNNYLPDFHETVACYQGWARNKEIRLNSSSGGLATAVALAFVKTGGVLYSCIYDKGEFIFSRITKEAEIKYIAGSKYVKSNSSGVYKQIRKDIACCKVLFIGLPCQVAAVKKFLGDVNQTNLYTIDLICHGTPSPKLLELFLNQYNKSLKDINSISFRKKNKMQLHINGNGVVSKGVSDKYTIAFLKGLTYTDNCYSCNYAQKNRVADMTLGDSWGSNLSDDEKKNGVSIILIQSNKGKILLENADVELLNVDVENAREHNLQLMVPSSRPVYRSAFFDELKHKKFNSLVFRYYPKECLRQDIKEVLLKLHIVKNDKRQE